MNFHLSTDKGNNMKKILIIFAFCAIYIISSSAKASPTITVFAAASTADAVKEMGKTFTKETGIKVRLNLGSSGSLARQLEHGAPADYYISASTKWAKYAASKGLLKKTSMTHFMKNTLVLIAPESNSQKPFNMTSESNLPQIFKGRLSIGDPRHVPVGRYAKAALEFYNWFKPLKKRLQPAKNARAALMVVEFGETELGIVYSTDAHKSSKVKVISTFPEKSHPPIVYVSAICKGATPSAAQFNRFLLSQKGAAILKKFGFQPIIQNSKENNKLALIN